MSAQMADPHIGMLSFQECLLGEGLDISPVQGYPGLYGHLDQPAPGTMRLTYVQLAEDKKTVKAFLACIMNGYIDGTPCVAVGYAVPETLRNQGLAKKIFEDVIQDQLRTAKRAGSPTAYIEAVVDVENVPSQRVAEAVLKVDKESITDSASGRPCYRYTAHFDTATGKQL